MAWIFADRTAQGDQTGSYTNLSSSFSLGASGSGILTRDIDAPVEHGAFYSLSAQGQIKHIVSKTGGQDLTTTATPTFKNMTVTGSLRAGAFIVTSSNTSQTASFGSGRSIFGDTPDDQHSLTGSLAVSGGLEFLHHDISGSQYASMSAGYFMGSGSGIRNVQVPESDHIPLDVWKGEKTAVQLPSGSRSTQPPGQRGLKVGGGVPGSKPIQMVTISTPADATHFGDISVALHSTSATSNGVNDRGISVGGSDNSVKYNLIEYITISTSADAINFGDLYRKKQSIGSTSNGPNERAVSGGGYTGVNQNDIEYVTISTTGNSNDFGDLTVGKFNDAGGSNGVHDRGLFSGGISIAVIDAVTISTTGNAHDFGDSTAGATQQVTNDLNDRSIHYIRNTTTMEYVTVSNSGNAVDFGDTTQQRYVGAGFSNGTDERGVMAGGEVSDTVNTIDYITISVLGNALDFGDLYGAHNKNRPDGLDNAAVPIWPYENAIDQVKLYASASADTALADRTYSMSLTGSYLHISASTIATSGGIHSGSSATLLEEIESGSLAISSNRPPGQIGVWTGGYTSWPTMLNTTDYITINSPGNATDFGDVEPGWYASADMDNGILNRGVFAGGDALNATANKMAFITISTPGNGADFGNVSAGIWETGGTSNGPNQRGIFSMGGPAAINSIEYITISTLGDSQDFGDLTEAVDHGHFMSNGVNDRGIRCGDSPISAVIDYVTISTTGDAIDFGDNDTNVKIPAMLSNDTNERGIIAGGVRPGNRPQQMQFITISTPGNSMEFGDMTQASTIGVQGTSNGRGERGVISGFKVGSINNAIDFLTISTPGNAVDFGDRTVATANNAGVSNGQTFYPHAALSQMRFSVDPMTVVQSKTEVSFASGSLQHYIASGGLFSTPIVTPSGSIGRHANSGSLTAQSGSNSFVNNIAPGAIGRTGVFEVWSGLIPERVTNLSGSSPNFTDTYFASTATGSAGTLHGFSGSSAFYASASIYNAYNASASFSGSVAATTLPGTNTIYRGEWITVASGSVLPGQRGCFGQGGDAEIDYVTISTLGNALHFGDGLVSMQQYMAGTDSGTNDRGFLTLGRTSAGADVNRIEMITISTPSNTVDYGDAITLEGRSSTALSNGPNDRAVLAQDEDDSKVMEFFSMRSFGNAIFFGDNQSIGTAPAGFSNGTDNRGIIAGGYNNHDEMEFINILSTGDASFFGNMVVSRNYNPVGASSNDHHQRGFIAGGHNARDEIDYVDIATLGNALDFGDISAAGHRNSSLSNGMDERGLIQLAAYTTVEFITISTPGNTTDFGDIRAARQNAAPMANSFTPPAISGSSMSVGQTFLSSSIMHGSGSSGAIDLPRNGFTGAESGSHHASASYVEVTNRIMNTTGSGADVSSSLLDFTSRSPGQRTVTGYTSNATDKNLLDAITMSSLGNAAIHGYNYIFSGTFIYGSGLSNGSGDRAIHRHNMGAAAFQCISISTPGNAGHFGNRAVNNNGSEGGLSNGSDQRGVFGLQTQATYITISTLGNAASFVGTKWCAGATSTGAMASNGRNQRGITFTLTNTRFFYFTISSLGNALDFGDGTTGGNYGGCTSNDINDRLVHHPVNSGTVEYITISTPSDALDFGNNIFGDNGNDSFSNGIGGRGFNIGDDGGERAAMAYYDIGNLGDSQVFGDLSQEVSSNAGFAGSNSAL